MLEPVTPQLLRAIVSLKTRSEGQVFLDWLARCNAAALTALVDLSDDTRVRWAQGHAQVLQEINSTIAQAPELVAKASR